MTTYRTHNPSTGRTVAEYPGLDDGHVDAVLARVTDGFAHWRATPPAERSSVLAAIAGGFEARSDELAAAISEEMGKPLRQAEGEVALAASIYRWYSEHGPALLRPETLDVPGARESTVSVEAVGPLVGVMPWNYPYYQVARFAAPNLMTGNTVILKHASICARSSALVELIQREAGLPEDAYVNVYASSGQVATMIADPRVRGVSLTGSEAAGAAVAEVAAKNLKKSVLELGGSDPLIILDTEDVDRLVGAVGRARLSNAGQACNSPKRMFVPEGIYDEFVTGLTDLYSTITVGPAEDPTTEMGPLSSEEARDGVVEQVRTAVEQGAKLRVGGDSIDRPGAFMEPTVLTDITPEMDVYHEEVFGPVAMVYRYSDLDEALRIANDTRFGLSGSVWGTDPEEAARVADRIEAGMVYVNEHGTTRAGLPFGGVKASGYGRELGRWGMGEFVNTKLRRVR
ncbi:NAD-dependent succinate-semialdehyde dehydrogenase [uncultured Dietzia sp.]|uniref:NAD-dependent succinate-semialdehyde dehydrogenase n=1 Tax=uncultured Dietzia sp. TaxID=395519 RepID=UPI002615848B|nr:NAD-dependent succinate-semialdehyde dehydrogenase [uncultured Dietzia sp.]HMT49176.1 NAD-dependent succinate-semialdehyde dehydrogenase [Dietzia sp.]